MHAHSFLKWVGGKAQILDEIMPLFPKEINNYHEPFLGGGSVLFALLQKIKLGEIKVSGKIYASDINVALIGAYKNIQTQPDKLLEELEVLTKQFAACGNGPASRTPKTLEEGLTSRESYYYWIRMQYNMLYEEDSQSPTVSAMLIFLNKTCFRGIYRIGKGFNVPYGNYKNPTIFNADNIHLANKAFENVVFSASPFQESLETLQAGDFMYLDPPYVPAKTNSFVSYNAGGFNEHGAVFEICRAAKNRGISFLLSNAEVPEILENFPASHFTIRIISCKRAINSKKPNSRANEVLIT